LLPFDVSLRDQAKSVIEQDIETNGVYWAWS
jgi:hypothetical protein